MQISSSATTGLVLSIISAIAGPASAATMFTSTLSGAQEVPAFSTPATGSATGQLTGGPGSYVFSYTVNYSGLLGTIGSPFAHIHNAVAGVNGGIVHDLDGANAAPIAGSMSGTITGDWRFDDASRPLTDTLATALLNNAAYFNIHTTARGAGEIRGQIIAVPEPSAIALAALAAPALLRRRRA